MELNTPLFLMVKVNNGKVTNYFSGGTNNDSLRYKNNSLLIIRFLRVKASVF